jgi:hypothetical protein
MKKRVLKNRPETNNESRNKTWIQAEGVLIPEEYGLIVNGR